MKIDIQRHWGYFDIHHPGELAAKIIEGMKVDGHVVLITKEIRSFAKSGLLEFLDEIFEFYQWPKDRLTIEFPDPTQTIEGRGYNLKYVDGTEFHFNVDLSKIEHRPWNGQKTYGMFIGRANTTRLYAAYRHLHFDYKNQGLTSFNQDIDYFIEPQYLTEYLCHTNQRWQDVRSIRPWSDIGPMVTPPITNQFSGPIWNEVYEKIAIEIVLETADTECYWAMTEKMFRPIIYKRPFILIAGRNFIKEFGKKTSHWARYVSGLDGSSVYYPRDFRYFENVIPLDYDADEGIDRVEHAFDILHELIRTGKIQTILEDCQEDILHNYRLLMELINGKKKEKRMWQNIYETKTWGLR